MLKKTKKYYTVKINGLLWTNVIDDINSEEIWGTGGIIFLSKKSVKEFVKNIKTYSTYKKSKFEIINLRIT